MIGGRPWAMALVLCGSPACTGDIATPATGDTSTGTPATSSTDTTGTPSSTADGEGSTSSSTEDPTFEPPTQCEVATFELFGEELDDTFDWSAPEQLVRCIALEDDAPGWRVRLAATPELDGTAGLHVDVDFYGVDGPAVHTANPYPEWPPDAGTFDVFVREGPDTPLFANMATSTECSAAVTHDDGAWLAGTFACDGLVHVDAMPDPSRTIDVHGGEFCCVLE